MDVHESPDSNLTTATFELPGIPKEKVEIKIHGKILTVSGQFTRSSEQQDRGYTTKERASGEFSRSVELPDGTDVSNELPFVSESLRVGVGSDAFSAWLQPKNVNASLENGVLTVTYPKSSPSQEVHRITIK